MRVGLPITILFIQIRKYWGTSGNTFHPTSSDYLRNAVVTGLYPHCTAVLLLGPASIGPWQYRSTVPCCYHRPCHVRRAAWIHLVRSYLAGHCVQQTGFTARYCHHQTIKALPRVCKSRCKLEIATERSAIRLYSGHGAEPILATKPLSCVMLFCFCIRGVGAQLSSTGVLLCWGW